MSQTMTPELFPSHGPSIRAALEVADADGVRDYLQLPPECEIVLPEDWGGDPGAAFPGLIGSDHRMAPLVLENRNLYLAAMFRRTGIIRHFLKMREK